MKINKTKLQTGFTIIEVMIVLAIAGLIMVIVFLAVPQLQRSQRNTSRKSVLNRVKTEVDNYSSNNNGTIPNAAAGNTALVFGDVASAKSFAGKYFGGANPVDVNDPQTGTSVLAAANLTFSNSAANAVPGTTPGNVLYGHGEICAGETTAVGSNRNYAILMQLEGGSVYCLDNH